MAVWKSDRFGVPICVDGRMLGTGGTGVSTYARSLAAAIGRLSDHPYRLVARRTDDGSLVKWMGALRGGVKPLHRTSDASGLLLEGRDLFRRAHVHFGFHRQLLRIRSDIAPGIMHWTYPVPMMLEGWINLYTVHDAIPLNHPDLTSINPRRHRAVLDAIVTNGQGITTVSQSAHAAIVAALSCDPAFVTDTGQPVDVSDMTQGPLPAGLIRYGYFLVVGSIEPRKNLTAILAAYRRTDLDLPLVVAGPDGWHSGPILAELAATPGTIRIPYVSRAALLNLIENARALIFPSLAEGFGLPMVEAMALGVPVLTSNRGALAEVAGGAALTVDPTDVTAISGAMVRLASDDALKNALSRSGTDRAALFSADRFRARLARLYGDSLQASALVGKGPDFYD